jgi:methionyl aminopeptidase
MFQNKSEFITLKDDLWLKRQRVAGIAVSSCIKKFAEILKNDSGMSLKDIQKISLEIIKSMDCTPTFLNYKGFPGAVCLSVNECLVHGIPSDYVLQDGDVVTLDLGATYEGAIADAAFTCIHGTPKNPKHIEMLALCQQSLNAGIRAIEIDKRVGVIGSAIWNTVKNSEFSLVEEYGGHSLSYDVPHADPFVPNKSAVNYGPKLKQGMTLAIEPILIMGKSSQTKILEDKWTVVGKDIGCHFEHTTFIHENYVEVITEHGMNYNEN